VQRPHLVGAQHRPSALQLARQAARRQDQHAPPPRDVAVEVGAAEDQQAIGLRAGDPLEPALLRVGLLQPGGIDPIDAAAPGVALRLDREQATRPDRDVVDVAAARLDVVEAEPTVVAQFLEFGADLLLSDHAPLTTVESFGDRATSGEHQCDQRDLGDDEDAAPESGRHADHHGHGHEQREAEKRVRGPGSLVQLLPESGGADEAEVGVWDPEALRRGGSLLERAAAVVDAAIECGLSQTALVLTEDRSAEDDRREGLDLLVFHDGFVEVDTAAVAAFERPVRPARARLVLVADGSGDVRWWDPSAEAGPIAADDLPMSADLTRAMQKLRAAYAELEAEKDPDKRGFARFEAALDRTALDEQAATLWKRARAELGRRFAVGFLGSGMQRPVWSPEELDDDDDSEIPF
jgi:hypothetical protein